MIAFLQWVLGGFWRFAGFASLLSVASGGIAAVIHACFPPKTIVHNHYHATETPADTVRAFIAELDKRKRVIGGLNSTRADALERM